MADEKRVILRSLKSDDEDEVEGKSVVLSGSAKSYGSVTSSEFRRRQDANLMEKSASTRFTLSSIKDLKPSGDTSAMAAIFIITNGVIGSAYLNLPFAAMNTGFVLSGIVFMIPMVLLTVVNMIILGIAVEKTQKATLEEMILFLCGKRGKNVADAVLVTYTFCASVSYIMVVSDQAFDLAQCVFPTGFFDSDKDFYKKMVTMVVTTLGIYPLLLPRDVSFLKYPGILSFLANFYMVGFVSYKAWEAEGAKYPTVRPTFNGQLNLLFLTMFAYQMTFTSVPIYSDLKKRTKENWVVINVVSMLVATVIYSTIACLGVLTFGDWTRQDILLNYSVHEWGAIVARLCVALSNGMSYPVVVFVGRTVIEDNYCKIFLTPLDADLETPYNRFFIEKTLFFYLSLACALFAPGLAQVFELAGVLATTSTLALPAILLFQICDRFYRRGLKSCLMKAWSIFIILINAALIVFYIMQIFQIDLI